MPIKLIAFDLDGTVLDDSKNIPPENIRALKAAADAGILIVPATGRIFSGILEPLRSFSTSRYSITCNGASAYDSLENKSIASAELSLELSLRVIDYIETIDSPVIYDCYQDNWGYICRHMYDTADEYITSPGMLQLMYDTRQPVESLRETLIERGRPVQKLQIHFKDMEEKERQLKLIPQVFPELAVTTSLPWNIEMNSSDSTKGNSLKALCAALEIELKDTLVFGDGRNDLELLSIAGIGVAMANAEPLVKAAADWIAPSNNEAGVAAGIYKFCNL